MEQIKLSIIMPVYNGSEFIHEAIDSLLAQNLPSYEFIVVDDGSTDDTLSILQEYQKKHPQFIVLSQENSGPSAARNNALNIAKGEFIYFFDADDILAPNGLTALYNRCVMLNADLIIADYQIMDEQRKRDVTLIKPLLNKEHIHPFDSNILWSFALWNKLFKRSLIEELQLRFPPVSYSEDGVFVMTYLYHCKRIAGLDKVILYYRKFNFRKVSSITQGVSRNKIDDYLTAHKMIYDAMHSLNDSVAPDYVMEFIRKEIQILLNQFYKKFYSIAEEDISYLVSVITERIQKLDAYSYERLCNTHIELPLLNLYRSYEEAQNNSRIAVLLEQKGASMESYMQSLSTLCMQNFVPMTIFVEAKMRDCIKNHGLDLANLVYLEDVSINEILKTNHPFEAVFVADSLIRYTSDCILTMYKELFAGSYQFISALLYTKHKNSITPLSYHEQAIKKLSTMQNMKGVAHFDCLFGNKLIRMDFLKELNLSSELSSFAVVKELYQNGFATYLQTPLCLCNIPDYKFVESYFNFDTVPYIQKYFEKPVTSLFDKRLNQPAEKMQLPLKNQVLFYCTKPDLSLSDNLQCLWDELDCVKKKLYVKPGADKLEKMRISYEVLSSKIILYEDYNKRLDFLSIREGQRYLHIGRANGLLKKFDPYHPHAQKAQTYKERKTFHLYNTSSTYLRDSYAQAFGCNMDKVCALGSPRTDLLMQDVKRSACQKECYEKYPILKGKKVLLYAPTFREQTLMRDYTNFVTPLPLEGLNHSLTKDTVLVIAPHPSMTNEICPVKYDNIMEIRDISTIRLMSVADCLITDYSSVFFDYCMLKKPIIFFCNDLSTYKRDFYLNYEEDLPGVQITSAKDLCSYLSTERYLTQDCDYDSVIEHYMSACDGNSTARIASLITDFLGGKKA